MFIVGNLVEKYSTSIEKQPWLKSISSINKKKPIAHAENKTRLEKAIKHCEKLGETGDKKSMYLYRYKGRSPILREIGRLRELSFRAVGEGTNKRRDIDQYDKFYYHLILWDDKNAEIVGAYRFGDAKQLTEHHNRLYSASLFNYHAAMQPYLNEGLELGRSFVQPKYWGKRSLDYLWFGIGAFLKKYPRYRYLFGPVSLSNNFPDTAKDLIVHFYQIHFSHSQLLASALTPYKPTQDVSGIFSGNNYKEDFTILKSQLQKLESTVPTLYKQYTETYEKGGIKFLDFSIDPDFNHCVDGLVLADLHQLKEKKRLRYMC